MEWPTDMVLDFIEEVKNLPILWNSSHPFYKISTKRMDAWQSLAFQFSTTVDEIRKKWTSLQAYLRREKAKELLYSGIDSKDKLVSKWFAYEAMKFMGDRYKPKDFKETNQSFVECFSLIKKNIKIANQKDTKIQEVPIESLQNNKETKRNESEDDIQIITNNEVENLNNCFIKEAPFTQCKSSTKRKYSEHTETNEDSFEKRFLEILDHHKSCPVQMNTDRAFFESLMPSIANFTEDQKIQFKIEILQLIQKIKSNQSNAISQSDTHYSRIPSYSYEYENSQSATPTNFNEQSNLTTETEFSSIIIKSE